MYVRFHAAALLTTTLLLAGCGGAVGNNDNSSVPPGSQVKLVLSEGTAAPPAMVNGECVVFTYKPTADELWSYWLPPVPATFAQVGDSIRKCIAGEAQPYLSQIPDSRFYRGTLYINTNGSCPGGDTGCYYDNNPTVDKSQVAWSSDPVIADWELSAIVGHEVWHAVAGRYHAQ